MSIMSNLSMAIPVVGGAVNAYNESKIIKSTEAKISKTKAMTQTRFNEAAKVAGDVNTRALDRATKTKEVVETFHLLPDGRDHLDLDKRTFVNLIKLTKGEQKEVKEAGIRFDTAIEFEEANTPLWNDQIAMHKEKRNTALLGMIPGVGLYLGIKNAVAIIKQNRADKKIENDRKFNHLIRSEFNVMKSLVEKTPEEKARFQQLLRSNEERAALTAPKAAETPVSAPAQKEGLLTKIMNLFKKKSEANQAPKGDLKNMEALLKAKKPLTPDQVLNMEAWIEEKKQLEALQGERPVMWEPIHVDVRKPSTTEVMRAGVYDAITSLKRSYAKKQLNYEIFKYDLDEKKSTLTDKVLRIGNQIFANVSKYFSKKENPVSLQLEQRDQVRYIDDEYNF